MLPKWHYLNSWIALETFHTVITIKSVYPKLRSTHKGKSKPVHTNVNWNSSGAKMLMLDILRGTSSLLLAHCVCSVVCCQTECSAPRESCHRAARAQFASVCTQPAMMRAQKQFLGRENLTSAGKIGAGSFRAGPMWCARFASRHSLSHRACFSDGGGAQKTNAFSWRWSARRSFSHLRNEFSPRLILKRCLFSRFVNVLQQPPNNGGRAREDALRWLKRER